MAICGIMGGLGRVKKIVDGLRTFSRLDEAANASARISKENLEDHPVGRRRVPDRAQVILDLADDSPPIDCYPASLDQVFLNILMNASCLPTKASSSSRGQTAGTASS